MTISSETNRQSYAGNGVTVDFDFNVYTLADADVMVILVNDTTGVETPQVITTNYTISVPTADRNDGIRVTMLVAPASGETLVVLRDPDFTQGLDLVENDPLPAEEVEKALDRTTMLAIRNKDRIDRALVVPDGDTSGADFTVPAPTALQVIGWSSDGLALQNYDISALGNVVTTTFTTDWLTSATAVIGRSKLGLVIGTNVQAQDAQLQSLADLSSVSNLEQVANASLVYVDKSQWPTIANNGADADHDIDFSAGSIPDSTGLKLLTLGSTMVKQIDATWAAGTNAGGRFPAVSLTADTTYHLFLIEKDSDGSIDAGFDTSPVAANIPAGYTAFRRVASVITDASSNIINFTQFGDRFELKDYILDLTTASPSTTGALLTLSAPSGLSTIEAHIEGVLDHTTTARLWMRSTSMNNTAPDGTHQDLVTIANGQVSNIDKLIPIDSNGQIRYRSSLGTVGGLAITCRGWVDPRIE